MNASCQVFQRLNFDGESLISVSVHRRLGESLMNVSVNNRLGDKIHPHAFSCIKIENNV